MVCLHHDFSYPQPPFSTSGANNQWLIIGNYCCSSCYLIIYSPIVFPLFSHPTSGLWVCPGLLRIGRENAALSELTSLSLPSHGSGLHPNPEEPFMGTAHTAYDSQHWRSCNMWQTAIQDDGVISDVSGQTVVVSQPPELDDDNDLLQELSKEVLERDRRSLQATPHDLSSDQKHLQ